MKPRVLFHLVIIIIYSFSHSVYSQTIVTDPDLLSAKVKLVDAWLKTKIEHDSIPGISVSVFNKDSILWEKGYGHSDVENNAKITPDTPLRTCSISKLFTALAVMRLEEKKLINIDEDFSKYLPTFSPLIENKKPINKVTFRNILTHTSGLATEANIPYFVEIDFPNSNELLKDVNTSNLLTEPDTKFRYSNLGYSLMGLAVQNTVNKNFNTFVQTTLISPLKLKNTFMDIELMPNPNKLEKGYGIRNHNSRKVFQPYSTKALSPAAGLISSSHDLASFGRWIINVSKGEDSLLRSSTVKKMIEPAWKDPKTENKRGLGFRYYSQGKNTYFGHGGYCSGYRAVLMIDSSMNLGISVLMNVNDESPYDIAFSIMNIMNLDTNYKPNLKNSSLKKYEGVYDRANMPERVVISSISNKLMVMDLFAKQPEETLWVLTPINLNTGSFKKEGTPVEGQLFFDRSKSGRLRFNRFYNYLLKIEH